MILVTSSSGVTGQELLKDLTALGLQVRAGYHSRPLSQPGVEGVRLDLTTGEGLDSALAGVEGIFLLTGDMADQTGAEIRVDTAAQHTGVRRLVKL